MGNLRGSFGGAPGKEEARRQAPLLELQNGNKEASSIAGWDETGSWRNWVHVMAAQGLRNRSLNA